MNSPSPANASGAATLRHPPRAEASAPHDVAGSPSPWSPPAHGGDLAAATARFGVPAAGWLDLSTGISPHPYPTATLPSEVWTRLPQADAEAALVATARDYYRVPAGARIVAAPGSQALIQALPLLRPPGRVAVLAPTYAEHLSSWRDAGHRIDEISDLDKGTAAEVCVVTQPNNPDGRTHHPETLRAAAEALAKTGGWLVVDEAFADAEPGCSLAPVAGTPGLIVLRSFGKFFGLAGVRLGFVLADRDVAASMARRLGPWAVSGPALELGRRALADHHWIAAARLRLAADSQRLAALLAGHGLRPLGGTALFRLAETANAAGLHERLAREGVLTRNFVDHPRWIRFGLPPGDAGFARLEAALDRACGPAATVA